MLEAGLRNNAMAFEMKTHVLAFGCFYHFFSELNLKEVEVDHFKSKLLQNFFWYLLLSVPLLNSFYNIPSVSSASAQIQILCFSFKKIVWNILRIRIRQNQDGKAQIQVLVLLTISFSNS